MILDVFEDVGRFGLRVIGRVTDLHFVRGTVDGEALLGRDRKALRCKIRYFSDAMGLAF